jgi:osmotically-inducible protein OsmY
MKKISLSILGLFLISTLAFAPATSTAGGQTTDQMMKKENTSKAKKETAPKSDDEVQRCIADKITNSEKLKSQGFNVSVSSGEVTFTGTARNAGSKGAMTRIAQSCGAKSVKNNITAPSIPRPKKSEAEKKN